VVIQIQLSEAEAVAIVQAMGAIVAALIGGIAIVRAARIQSSRPPSTRRGQRRGRRSVKQSPDIGDLDQPDHEQLRMLPSLGKPRRLIDHPDESGP
jgi:hypothetical protein